MDSARVPGRHDARIEAERCARLVLDLLELIPAHQLFHEVHLDLLDLQEFLPLMFEQDVELFVEVADFQLGFEVHLIVILRAQPVARFHAALAHHDDRRLKRRQAGEQ